ncbi:MAG: hypothetical protein ACUVXJ_19895 [Phycisphaerae bacterium]
MGGPLCAPHKIKSGDVVLPARTADGSERPIRPRCVTTPNEAQKVLLHRLGLNLPQRLRRIDEVIQMSSRHSSKNGPGAIAKAILALKVFNLG